MFAPGSDFIDLVGWSGVLDYVVVFSEGFVVPVLTGDDFKAVGYKVAHLIFGL